MSALCRDCFTEFETAPLRCPKCARPRIAAHDELFDLAIAHMDCDAFYASVEKRDNPALVDKPVIIGGGRRGVVSTACYIARVRGVKSAMPMFQALKLCPDAVVLPPRMSVYADVSKEIRALMKALTPAVEPLSLDEAFMDLRGTQKLHGAPPAVMLAKLVAQMKEQLGITGSIGLSHNKFLAKIASDMNKPRGFSLIGLAETDVFLQDKPVRLIWGVGKQTQKALEGVGIHSFADLRRWGQEDLNARFGSMGLRLWHISRGQDRRRVESHSEMKSISHETTFTEDTGDKDILDGHIWRLSEKVSDRLKARDMAGQVVVLKLKRSNHTSLSRRISLHDGTQMADRIYHNAKMMFDQVAGQGPFRLIGVGVAQIIIADKSDLLDDLLDPQAKQRGNAERATDKIRARFGKDAIKKGRALR